jgi:hypothetical protein
MQLFLKILTLSLNELICKKENNRHGGAMAYTHEALMDKIREIYPEIRKHGIVLGLDFNVQKNAYIVKFTKGRHELTTHLEKKDADDCMNNIKCVYLGVQIGQFVRNFEEAE